MLKSDKDVWTRAESIRDAILPRTEKLDRGGLKRVSELNGMGKILFTQINVEFGTLHFGYKSELGADLSLQLDSTDGELLGMSRRDMHYKYISPKIRISKDQALKSATLIVKKAKLPQSSFVYRTELMFTKPSAAFASSKGAENSKKRVSKLCYWVNSPLGVIYIDAETGECLGGYEAVYRNSSGH